MRDVHVDGGALRRFGSAALVAAGIPQGDAETVADVLVFADTRGIGSHGVSALSEYIRHLQAGGVNARPQLKILAEGPAYALVDGDAAMGPITAARCTRIAIEKADAAGIGCVSVRNSNHFGAGAYYALAMARAGMIGEVMANVPPMVAPTGGKARMLGTNPLTIAAPCGTRPPLVLDMAMSAVAGGRVIGAATANKPIPEGWLLTPEGLPTTDPHDFHRGGALLPFGGYKGYGLALAIETFSGVLSGAGILSEVTSFRRQPDSPGRVGHMFRATKIEAFMPPAEFVERMDRMIAEMKDSPKAEGVEAILVPGELEVATEGESKRRGVKLSGETFATLEKLAGEFQLEPLSVLAQGQAAQSQSASGL